MSLDAKLPESVAAALLRRHLHRELWFRRAPDTVSDAAIDRLKALAATAGLRVPPWYEDWGELDAWFTAAYQRLSAKHLKSLKLETGDIVIRGGDTDELLEVASIAPTGVVYFKGGKHRAHPDRLKVMARTTSSNYTVAKQRADRARAQYAPRVLPGAARLLELAEFKVAR
ncbi:hypothetical protein [Nocardia asteroides]|uniref:hypothetical protein n=1 Tax=Nocardia asteroides TaxID=1824 RepID=UPI003424542E